MVIAGLIDETFSLLAGIELFVRCSGAREVVNMRWEAGALDRVAKISVEVDD